MPQITSLFRRLMPHSNAKKSNSISTISGALLSAACACSMASMPAHGAPALLSYGAVSPTVAGISAGGFMAVQMSVAYSSTFKGAAVFAGGPYYCAADTVELATTSCLSNDPPITQTGINAVEADTSLWADYGWISPTSNLANQKIYLYSGTNDTTVVQPVVTWLQTYYKKYISSSNIVYNNTSPAGHAWVTWKSGSGINSCTVTASPYLNNCSNDPEHDMLAQLYGSVTAHAASATGTLVAFDQTAFVPGGATASYSVDTTGYIYVPTHCTTNSGCKAVVVLHGCLQGYSVVGNALTTNSGLNEYADTNNLLIIYPQLILSPVSPYNPNGCWDFWGYTGTAYPIQSGVQPAMIKEMVSKVMGTHY